MADTDVASTEKKHRSPAYPFISLNKAVEQAQKFYQAERRHAAPLGAAAKHWGYGEKSSGGLQTVSALKQYGLLADEGGGNQRKVKLTERAFRILLDEVKDSPERAEAMKHAALAPKLFAEMFKKWGIELPSDETIRTFLRVEKQFNDDALNGVIKSFKDTLAYAKLDKSDKIADNEGDNGDTPKITVGDYIQWESQGAWQFAAPKKVVGLSDDAEWVFAEGEATGIPMEQVLKVDAPSPPITPKLAPPTPPGLASKPIVGVAREVFALEDGEAVLQWPTTLNAEGVEELEDWLTLVIKKLKRLKKASTTQENPNA